MKISIVTDEISADPETAIELGVEWGVHDFELRGSFTDRAPMLSGYQRQHLRDVLDEHHAKIIAIGPGLFKCACPPERPARLPLGWMERAAYDSWTDGRLLVEYHLHELLPASLDYANELGAHLLVIFGFDRAGAAAGLGPEPVLDCLRRAAERAQAAGMEIAVENEEGFWADTGLRTAELVRAVNHPSLGINWDPGNAFAAGDEPFPQGYQHVRGLVRHVHFKDAVRRPDGIVEQAVEGQIDWPGQIRAMEEDGYEGFISVETHMRPKVHSGRASLERLAAMVAAARATSPARAREE